MFVSGLLFVVSAFAQEADPIPELAPVGAPESIGGGAVVWREERGAARLESGLQSLARAADGAAWLLGLEDGSVWRSIDGARTWSRVLRSPEDREAADDEELLLEGEVLAEEEAARDERRPEAVDPEDPDAAEAPAPDVSDVPSLDELLTDPLLHRDAADRGAVVWTDPRDPTLALSGRADGIWRSTDAGRTWRRVDGGADAWRFLAVPELGVVVAGTSQGVRVSPDAGLRWFDPVDVTDGLRVDALTTMDGTILAGTAGGLFRSADGLRWSRLPLEGAVTALLPDPGWQGGLWVGTSGGVLRSDDAGQSFVRQGRQVLPRLRGLAPLQGQGHLLAWNDDGVWESLDGGVTWLALFRGLTDPDVRDVVVVDGLPIAAASTSVWRLGYGRVAGGRGDGLEDGAVVSADEQARLGLFVDLATRRQGLDLAALQPAALTARAWIPTVTVDVERRDQEGRTASFLAVNTVDDDGGYWRVSAKLCFGRCVGTVTVTDVGDGYYEYTADAAEAGDVADELYVAGGEVVGDGAEAFSAANTAQKMRRYRQLVAEQVVGAWTTWQTLSLTGRPPSLAGKVARALDIQEAEARLDLYTDGAFTRAKLSESQP